MATWMDSLRAAYAAKAGRGLRSLDVRPPSPSTWLAAAVLDRAGLWPDDILDGITILVSRSAGLRSAIETLVVEVFGRDVAQAGTGRLALGGLLLVPRCIDHATWPLDVAMAGASALVLVDSAADVVPAMAGAMADESLLVDAGCGRDEIVQAVAAVTGGEPDLPQYMARMPFEDAVAAIHYGATTQACESRIQRWVQARAREDRRAMENLGEAPAEPAAPVGQAAAGVVKRLSEMTGFGEAGKWGLQLAADLQAYARRELAWSEVDRGVLLSGPPGSGKTTFARALALEAGVELVSSSYGDLANGSSSDIAKLMAKKFELWREKAKKGPIVVLIDEIDTLGVRGNNAHNDSYWGGVINSMLAFLDGATPRDGIVVVGATNHPGNVDPALVRPGRLDRHVELPYPDASAMAGIVRHHLGPGAAVDEADLARAARACRGMSPAEVEQVCREARRTARTLFKRAVTPDDVSLVLGARRLEALQRPGAREVDRRVAVHEAAHAIAMLSSTSDVLAYIDMDQAMTWARGPTMLTLAEAESRLVVLLAGLAAEQVLLGGHSSGVSADLREATSLATTAHAGWGMGVLGYRAMAVDEAMADPTVTAAVDAILAAAHARARAMVEASREAILRLAGALEQHRYLDAAEIRTIVDDPRPAPQRTACGDRVTRTVGRRGRHP